MVVESVKINNRQGDPDDEDNCESEVTVSTNLYIISSKQFQRIQTERFCQKLDKTMTFFQKKVHI